MTKPQRRAAAKPNRPAILEAAMRHYDDTGVKTVEVPEWRDDNGDPFVIYYKPMTMAEVRTLAKRHGAMTLGDPEIVVDLIIMKALDGQGEKLFTIEHKLALMNKVEPSVLFRIGQTLGAAPDPEEAEKN